MSYSDLPTGWAERPIIDPDIFEDVVDLIATESSRQDGCLYALICDDDGRMAQPLAVDGWQYDNSRPAQEQRFEWLCNVVTHVGFKQIALIIARRGHHAPTGNDRQFRALAEQIAARHDITILGIAIATPLAVASWPPQHPANRRSA